MKFDEIVFKGVALPFMQRIMQRIIFYAAHNYLCGA
tara:strand:- start:411 stop:518 length:108 start_codon:yes stop_codon:yes gene_type:complete